jgi:hypothetical protein
MATRLEQSKRGPLELLFNFGTLGSLSDAELLQYFRARNASSVIGPWADGARKPKLLMDRQFALPGGAWARRLHQKPTVNVAGPTASRNRDKAVVHVTRLGICRWNFYRTGCSMRTDHHTRRDGDRAASSRW